MKTLDKAYLEYSQITGARTKREIQARQTIELLLNIIKERSSTFSDLSAKEDSSVYSAKVFLKEFD